MDNFPFIQDKLHFEHFCIALQKSIIDVMPEISKSQMLGLMTDFMWHIGSMLNKTYYEAGLYISENIEHRAPPRITQHEFDIITNAIDALSKIKNINEFQTRKISDIMYDVYQISRAHHAAMH
jgi:hypothetical protein